MVAKSAEDKAEAIAAAADALPEEPAVGGKGVVDVAVQLADGRRVRRRFHRSHPMRAIFAFLVSDEHLESGTFRLCIQRPRLVFKNCLAGGGYREPTLDLL